MTPDEIEALLRLAASRGLVSFEIEANDASLRLVFEEREAPAVPGDGELPAAVSEPPADAVLSPGVGFFRPAHPAGGAALLGEARAVAVGTVVGFVQAGPLLQPVVAPRAGKLGALLVKEGAGVGFGTPLYGLA